MHGRRPTDRDDSTHSEYSDKNVPHQTTHPAEDIGKARAPDSPAAKWSWWTFWAHVRGASTHRTNWTHQPPFIGHHTSSGTGARASPGTVLTAAGKAGWELVTVYDNASNWFNGMEKGIMLMKRTVPADVTPDQWCVRVIG